MPSPGDSGYPLLPQQQYLYSTTPPVPADKKPGPVQFGSIALTEPLYSDVVPHPTPTSTLR